MKLQYRARVVLLVSSALVAFTTRRAAAQNPWQPAAGHAQIPIWPGAAPDGRPVNGAELSAMVVDSAGQPKLVGGKPWVYVDRVTRPTMTVYSPAGRNSGAAVVVFPGGGYNVLAIDLEGTDACDWLVSHGITCILSKYRVPCAKTGPYRDCRTALEDAQRTIGLVRFGAPRWKIDPHRIGVLGFSAGGHIVAATSTHFAKRLYAPVDAADSVSCRPDFAIALYPGHLAVAERGFALNPDIRVSSRTPPTLLIQAEDDPVDPVENSLVYHAALRRAHVPVEMHLYATGGHAFGLRRTSFPITAWPQLAEEWLARIGVIPSAVSLDDSAGSAEVSSASDSSAVAGELARFLGAFENLDWVPFRAAFSDSATVFHPSASARERVTGRVAIDSTFREVFADVRAHASGGPPYHRLTPVDLRIQPLAPGVVLATFELRNAERFGRRTVLFRRQGDAWRIIHLHASNIAQPTEPPR